MKLSGTTLMLVQMLCSLTTSAETSLCQTNQQYPGTDLLIMHPSYENLMMGELQYWAILSNTDGLSASKDNIYKSFFNCMGDHKLKLAHWCGCGIEDDVNGMTGEKIIRCVMPCGTPTKQTGEHSRAGSSSMSIVMTAVGAAALLFAVGMV